MRITRGSWENARSDSWMGVGSCNSAFLTNYGVMSMLWSFLNSCLVGSCKEFGLYFEWHWKPLVNLAKECHLLTYVLTWLALNINTSIRSVIPYPKPLVQMCVGIWNFIDFRKVMHFSPIVYFVTPQQSKTSLYSYDNISSMEQVNSHLCGIKTLSILIFIQVRFLSSNKLQRI